MKSIVHVCNKKEGFALINVLVALLIVSLIGLLGMNMIIINNSRKELQVCFRDLNYLSIEDDYLSFLNYKLNNNKALIDELFNLKEVVINEKNIVKVTYDEINGLLLLELIIYGNNQILECKYKYDKDILIVYLNNQKYKW